MQTSSIPLPNEQAKSPQGRANDLNVVSAIAMLTPAERRTLLMVRRGLTARQTAEQLNLSVRTVENQRFNIRRRLNLRGWHSLFRFALNAGDVLETV